MKDSSNKKPIINAHTHIFTANFVPPYLAKSLVPFGIWRLLTTAPIVAAIRVYLRRRYGKKYGYDTSDKKLNLSKEEEKKRDQEKKEELLASRRRDRSMMQVRTKLSTSALGFVLNILGVWLSINTGLYLIEFINYAFGIDAPEWLNTIKTRMAQYYLYIDVTSWVKIVLVVLGSFAFKSLRRIFWQIIKAFIPIVKKIFSKEIIHLATRYWEIGRYSFYTNQNRLSQRVLSQLPKGSEIVILPMDMEYMGAGKTKLASNIKREKRKKLEKRNELTEEDKKDFWKEDDFDDSFKYQMRELWELVKEDKKEPQGPQDRYHPFLFIDPRRVLEENNNPNKENFFDYELVKADAQGTICEHGEDCSNCQHNRIVLKDCFVKTYMEDRRFAGFKIYPALGYYPFDETLLPIWRYAAENDIPIMTHCVIGVIHYRGQKKKEWNFHPVFKMEYEQNVYEPMMLPEKKPVEFQVIFTHPLNYLCLVEERFLKTLVGNGTDQRLQEVFGYNKTDDTLAYNLKNLKICLAHYGGADEWARYMEQDRVHYSQRIMRNPDEAIKFMENSQGRFSWDKIYQLWFEADWYSIISSLLIRYDNMYADISYIASKPSIYPLLKYSLEKGEDFEQEHEQYKTEKDPNKKALAYSGKNKLRSRILFGTDFYVVRNHKSDKNIFVEIKTLLSEEDFDLIARENTHNYLYRKYNYTA